MINKYTNINNIVGACIARISHSVVFGSHLELISIIKIIVMSYHLICLSIFFLFRNYIWSKDLQFNTDNFFSFLFFLFSMFANQPFKFFFLIDPSFTID